MTNSWGSMHRPWDLRSVWADDQILGLQGGGISVLGSLSRCIARADVVQEVAYSGPVLNLALKRQAVQLLGGFGQRSLVEEAVVA